MAWFHALRERVADLFVRDDGDLDEEMAHHLDLETRRLIERGADPRLARRLALERFGNPHEITAATRRARGYRFMEGGMQDLRWAIRSLRKSAGFTALALATLTLGIGATTAAFTVMDTVLLEPLPYPRPDRLVIIEELTKEGKTLLPSYPNFDDWRSQAKSFEHVASTNGAVRRVSLPNGDAVGAVSLGVSRNFFETLHVTPYLGRSFTVDENRLGGPKVVMVSYEFWKEHLNANPALGQLVLGDTPYRIVGVTRPGFQYMQHYDLIYPHEQAPGTVRSAHYLRVVARLKDGVTLAEARSEMHGLSARLIAVYGKDTQAQDVRITPLREFFVGNYRLVLEMVLAGSILVLLVACTNLVSAQLARGLVRGREVAIRAALGASRTRLIRQLFIESVLLVVAGACLGATLGVVLLRIVRALGAASLPRLGTVQVNGTILIFTALVAAAVAVLIGVYPALRSASTGPADALRGAARGMDTNIRAAVWNCLVAFEVAMAVVLVAGSVLLVRTLHNILTNDVGFAIHGVVTAELASGDQPAQRLDAIRADLASLPGVGGVAYANAFPLLWGNWAAPALRPLDPIDHDWPAFAGYRVVTPNYFAVLKQPILEGRGFTEDDRAGTPLVAVITSGLAQRLWPGENPLGKQVRSNQDVDHLLNVVGIVAEATSWTMDRGSQNEIYAPMAQHPNWYHDPIAFIRASGSTAPVQAAAAKRLRETARDIPARIGLLDDRVMDTAASRRFAMFALVTFGGIALVLAALGIYGVLAYSVTSRRFEIGVRMALGATRETILRRTLSGAVVTATLGIACGSALALWGTRYLKSLLYGVTPLEPTAYAAGTLLLLAVALFGAYIPARRASRVDPMLAIRGE